MSKAGEPAEKLNTETADSLEHTVGTFAQRLNRKLKEKEAEDSRSKAEAGKRHARMLQAMTTIRKALQESCKISLGDRFYLEVEVLDWEGWPRVDLILRDNLCPDRIDYSLVVTANDYKDLGTVKLAFNTGRVIDEARLSDQDELKRLPRMLKTSVRAFLDVVANYVLNPVNPDDLIEQQTRAIEEEPLDEVGASLQDQDLFTDEYGSHDDNLVSAEEASPSALSVRFGD